MVRRDRFVMRQPVPLNRRHRPVEIRQPRGRGQTVVERGRIQKRPDHRRGRVDRRRRRVTPARFNSFARPIPFTLAAESSGT